MKAIVAVYSDWGIGCDGTQPIVIPEDRKVFQSYTSRKAIIVGRKTLDDFPEGKPLRNRHNIVISKTLKSLGGAEVADSVDAAVELSKKYEETIVCGGASVYEALMPYIDEVKVTKIQAQPASDSFFTNLDEDPLWDKVEESEPKTTDDGVTYSYCTYKRNIEIGGTFSLSDTETERTVFVVVYKGVTYNVMYRHDTGLTYTMEGEDDNVPPTVEDEKAICEYVRFFAEKEASV